MEVRTMQRIEQSIRVDAPVARVYEFWRNFESFPRFMEHVEQVRLLDTDGRRSHWKITGPLGTTVEYDAELTRDIPNREIAWNSSGGSMETSGTATFRDIEGATEVHVLMQWYDPPGGPAGEVASRVLQDPEAMLMEDLRRFKAIVEGRAVSGPSRE
jgi:uncharacterized membrane protein